jgi:hypothetical protein
MSVAMASAMFFQRRQVVRWRARFRRERRVARRVVRGALRQPVHHIFASAADRQAYFFAISSLPRHRAGNSFKAPIRVVG